MTNFPIDQVRAQFPALAVTDGGSPRIYFDAPGGTQICRQAIARMVAHLERGTANAGGAFVTSLETVALTRQAHAAMADLLNGKEATEGATLSMGKKGETTVGANAEAVMGEPFEFNKANVEEFAKIF